MKTFAHCSIGFTLKKMLLFYKQMREFLKSFLKWLLIVVDGFVVFCNKTKKKSNLLVVRLDAIGDFIIWLDSAKRYRQLYPDQKIILIANAAWADMAQGLPYWDEVWPVKLRDLVRKPFYRWELLRRVRKTHFSTAIQPTFSRILMHGDSLIRATHATQRIGSIGDTANISAGDKATSDLWYTRLLPATDLPLMELERNAEFNRSLGAGDQVASVGHLPVLADLPSALTDLGCYFVIFPGASWVGRMWPTLAFAAVARRLAQDHDWRLVVCGSQQEAALAEVVIRQAALPGAVNLAGKTSLAEFAEVVRHAQCLIGNETSAVHIAAAVGTASVCVLGGGHFGRFMPYTEAAKGMKPVAVYKSMPCFRCNWECNQANKDGGSVPCISGITVEQVLAGAEQALAKSPRS